MENKPRLRPFICQDRECNPCRFTTLHIAELTATDCIYTCRKCGAKYTRKLYNEGKLQQKQSLARRKAMASVVF